MIPQVQTTHYAPSKTAPQADTVHVAFVVGGLYTQASGVARIVCDLANALARRNAPVDVYTAQCNGRDVAREMLLAPNRLFVAPGAWMFRLSRSPELKRMLETAMPDIDLVHNHSIWMLPNSYATRSALRHNKPVIYTAHGTLEPWSLARSRWKKRLARLWFQDRDLHQADCIHVNTYNELEGIRRFGLKQPAAVIPNGVDLAAIDAPISGPTFDEMFPQVGGRKICLFLSRLHAKKGLVPLLHAWARIAGDFKDWLLVLAGPDDGGRNEALQLIDALGLQKSVLLTGPLFQDAKRAALAAADVFVLPSFSEGFSMAVLEAMAARLPVLLTPGCNFDAADKADAGIMVNPEPAAVADGLTALLALSDGKRREMGQRGRDLVERSYTWDIVAGQMQALYCWLAGSTAQPDFVEFA